jgi:uncharacterized protein YmfQ (DUF2313 family)
MDYAFLIYHLLPQGPIWPRESGDAPWWDALISALAAEFGRIHEDAQRLLSIWIDIPDEWLEDFERLLGLSSGVLTNSQRRSQINAKFAQNSGISFPDIDATAATWGATVAQHQFSLFLMNQGAMGDPLRGEQWLATITITYVGATDPALEAALRAAVPPNNSIIFAVA